MARVDDARQRMLAGEDLNAPPEMQRRLNAAYDAAKESEMKDVPETFQTAFDRHRRKEMFRGEVLTLLWALGTFVGVITPSNYGVKALAVVASFLAILVLLYYMNPDAIFHRAWTRASKEVYGR